MRHLATYRIRPVLRITLPRHQLNHHERPVHDCDISIEHEQDGDHGDLAPPDASYLVCKREEIVIKEECFRIKDIISDMYS